MKICTDNGEILMRLTELHTRFKTDKGTAHTYIPWYEQTFSERRLDSLNVLEIGVLFGGSLKMWETYFENSYIYGIEDFSQKDGQWYYQFEPVDGEMVMRDVNSHKRITLFNFDCENLDLIQNNLKGLKFDIIIDDANHLLAQQIKNFQNYFPYLNDGGIYVCEDVQSTQEAIELKEIVLIQYPDKKVHIVELEINKKSDDRLVVIL